MGGVRVRRPSLSSYAIALLLIGITLLSVGVGFQFGLPWGLMLCGMLLTMGGVVLVRDLLRRPPAAPRRPASVPQVRVSAGERHQAG
jgi:hypothetical protein